MKTVNIVVPVYNEAENIPAFISAVEGVMRRLPYAWEVTFVNDGSTDSTLALLRKYAARPHISYLSLAKNSGHQIALTAGLMHADADAVISMDGDLQHPPALLPRLLKLWEGGADIVQTLRETTEGVSPLKNITSHGFYKFLSLLSKNPPQDGASDFRLLSRPALMALKQYGEHGRFLRGMVADLGFTTATLKFTAPPRFAGKSKYTLRKMLTLAKDGVLFEGHAPLRLPFLFAALLAPIGLALLALSLLTGSLLAGVFSAAFLVASPLFLALGVMGEYLGAVLTEARNRPLYIIAEEGGAQSADRSFRSVV